MMLLCCCKKYMSFLCNQVLIRRNYILTGSECLKDHRLRRLHTAHNFNYDLNLIIFNNIVPIICQKRSVYTLSLLIYIANKNLLHFHLSTDCLLHHISTLLNQFIDTGSYCSKSENCYLYCFHYGHLFHLLSLCNLFFYYRTKIYNILLFTSVVFSHSNHSIA